MVILLGYMPWPEPYGEIRMKDFILLAIGNILEVELMYSVPFG
jgi:hypothetical protein